MDQPSLEGNLLVLSSFLREESRIFSSQAGRLGRDKICPRSAFTKSASLGRPGFDPSKFRPFFPKVIQRLQLGKVDETRVKTEAIDR